MEGTGDNIIDPLRGIIFAGKGQRNQEGAAAELQYRTGARVVTLETKRAIFSH